MSNNETEIVQKLQKCIQQYITRKARTLNASNAFSFTRNFLFHKLLHRNRNSSSDDVCFLATLVEHISSYTSLDDDFVLELYDLKEKHPQLLEIVVYGALSAKKDK